MLLTRSVICAQVSNFSALQAMVCNWWCFYKRCSSGVNQVFALHPYDFLFFTSGICLQMIFSICKSICNLPWLPVIAAVEEGSTQPWTAAERLPCNPCARQTSVCTFFAFSLSFCLLPLFPSFFIYHSVFFFLLLILHCSLH